MPKHLLHSGGNGRTQAIIHTHNRTPPLTAYGGFAPDLNHTTPSTYVFVCGFHHTRTTV